MLSLIQHEKEIYKEYGIHKKHQLYPIEMASYEHLLEMSERGVKVNTKALDDLVNQRSKELAVLAYKIYVGTGIVAPNSNAQVALFFKSQGYDFPKTAKGNPRVNQETLADNPSFWAKDIMDYRKKLASLGQLKSLSKEVVDGRVHPKYLATKCATGRIYTEAPNIQGWGEDAKSLIAPDPGYKLMIADYKGQELRIVAAITECKALLDAFDKGIDVHRSTYALMNNCPVDEVTDEQRAIGKVLNFATIYGQSPAGLAANLKVSKKEAERLQNLYFKVYPEIKTWSEKMIEEVRSTGTVCTPWGRARKIYFGYDQSKADRQIVNTPIQGAGADVMKRALAATNLHDSRVQVLLTVHDSLIIQYREDLESEKVENWLRHRMEINFLGKVKLEVEIK